MIGVVVIGRNEGPRLERALASAREAGTPLLYVDSGSVDGSAERAHRRGVAVLELGTERPYSAARARNEGARALAAREPCLRLVLFVDADCELSPDFPGRAVAAMTKSPELVCVTGHREEREPRRNWFHRLCDMEWDRTLGRIASCGGDAAFRLDALIAAGGFDERLVAGEEFALCERLRAAGGTIERLDAPMTRHDCAIVSWRQWLTRARRCGAAYGLGIKHYADKSHCLRRAAGIVAWAFLVPSAAAVGLWFAPVATASIVTAMIAAFHVRVARGISRQRGVATADALIYALSCLLCKAPQLIGLATTLCRRSPARLIEYKS